MLARSRPGRPPVVPELQLHLADDMDQAWSMLQDELDDGDLPPPFWAFAWLGGQAVARHLLDHPDLVRGRRVLDLATVELNAALNGLHVDVLCADLLDEPPPDADVVLAGDVFYDAAMSERVQPWLLGARRAGAAVLVGDPGRHYLPRALCTELAAVDVPTTRALEGVDRKTVRVYALG